MNIFLVYIPNLVLIDAVYFFHITKSAYNQILHQNCFFFK